MYFVWKSGMFSSSNWRVSFQLLGKDDCWAEMVKAPHSNPMDKIVFLVLILYVLISYGAKIVRFFDLVFIFCIFYYIKCNIRAFVRRYHLEHGEIFAKFAHQILTDDEEKLAIFTDGFAADGLGAEPRHPRSVRG